MLCLSYESLANNKGEFIEINIESKITKQNLSFKVSLPQSYDDTINKSYPVFITASGSSRLDMVTSQVKWLSHVNFAPLPQVIIVTLPNINFEDKDKFASVDGNESAILSAVLRNEILPYIDDKYRTTSYRVIEGFSTLGNFPLYMLRHHSDVINAYFIFSPALELDKSGLIDSLSDDWYPSSERQNFVFLSLGSFSGNRDYFEQAKSALTIMNKSNSFQFEFADYSDDNYLSSPNIGLAKASQLAFGDLQPDYSLFHDKGESALIKYFDKIAIKYGERIDLKSKLTDLSFSYADDKQFTKAIKIMERLLARNTKDTLLYIRMAQIQMKAKKDSEAKSTLNKAYELANIDKSEEQKSYIQKMLSKLN